MARSAAKRRVPKPPVDGRVARRTPPPPRQPAPEDLMFFPRLRRQAKWMFVFLALVFGVGFVAFGVGSSLPSTGIIDIFQGGGATGEESVGDARDRIEANPNDADAHLDLSRAHQRDGNIEEAIPPLEKYTKLRPKDESALQELAGLHTTQASDLSEEAALAAADRSSAAGLGLFQLSEGPLTNVLKPGPLDEALAADAQQRLDEATEKRKKAYQSATNAYERLVKLSPRDANFQYLLASSAEQAAEYQRAIKAYRAFLDAAPDAPEAQFVRDRIKQLEQIAQNTITPGKTQRINIGP